MYLNVINVSITREDSGRLTPRLYIMKAQELRTALAYYWMKSPIWFGEYEMDVLTKRIDAHTIKDGTVTNFWISAHGVIEISDQIKNACNRMVDITINPEALAVICKLATSVKGLREHPNPAEVRESQVISHRMSHREKALEAWREDHYGSSQGFDEAYGS